MLKPLSEMVESIEALHGRVHGAARLSDLRARGGLLQVCPAAFVLPLGLRGGAPSAATGLFRQAVEWLEGVVLAVRAADDAVGSRALAQLDPLIDAVIGAVVGMERPDRIGTYRLAKGELLSLDAGLLIYQLDFAIEDQLRIAR